MGFTVYFEESLPFQTRLFVLFFLSILDKQETSIMCKPGCMWLSVIFTSSLYFYYYILNLKSTRWLCLTLGGRSICFKWSAATIKQLKLSGTSFLLFLEMLVVVLSSKSLNSPSMSSMGCQF